MLASTLAALALAAAVHLAPQPPEGITLTPTAITARSGLAISNDGKASSQHTISVALSIKTTDAIIVATEAKVTQVIDTHDLNLITTLKTKRAANDQPRRLLEERLRHLSRTELHTWSMNIGTEISTLPARITQVHGYAQCASVGQVITRDVNPSTTTNPIELSPGVTFRWIKSEPREGTVNLAYEVRIRRFTDPNDGTPGLEPIFGGIFWRSDKGNTSEAPFTSPEQRSETPDEYVYTCRAFPLSKEMIARIPGWSATVYDHIHTARIEFDTGEVTITQ